MTVRVAINRLGRTGRAFYRARRGRVVDIDVVAVNDLAPPDTLAQLLRHDSVYGPLGEEVQVLDGAIAVGAETFSVFREREPKHLPWAELDVDVVIESSGHFTDRDSAAAHLDAGASRVVVSAPSKGADGTFVIGVNEDAFDPDHHRVVSNASCTTNCFVPMVKVLDDAFGYGRGS